jgi:hypothetical protein
VELAQGLDELAACVSALLEALADRPAAERAAGLLDQLLDGLADAAYLGRERLIVG